LWQDENSDIFQCLALQVFNRVVDQPPTAIFGDYS
jgi:hypothetical protein